jgi:hypothetical protein
MRRAILMCWILFAVTSCATSPPIIGPYAERFTVADLQDITALVSQRRDIKHTITKIAVIRPDHALVATGRMQYTGDVENTFAVDKRKGKWMVDESSFKKELVIITAH